MARPALEVADIFRDHGAAWRHANRGHVSLPQLKVMSAIERTHTAARSNLHSARQRSTQPHARPFTGGFRTTAPSASRFVAMGRHPKPLYEREVVKGPFRTA